MSIGHGTRKAERLMRIIQILEGAPHGLSVQDLHKRLFSGEKGVSLRSIYRDLEALSSCGHPLVKDGGSGEDERGGLWRLEGSRRIGHTLQITPRELMGLFLARSALEPLRDTYFYSDIASIFKKIEARLGVKSVEYLQELGEQMHFQPLPKWGLGVSPDVLDTIHAACAEGHIIEADYESAHNQQRRKRRLGPHYLYFSRGALYLVAEDIESSQIKVYALPRFHAAFMTEEAYEGEKSDPQRLFAGSFGVFTGESQRVRIEFHPEIAPYIRERSWHPSQRVVAHDDGRVTVEFHVGITPEFFQWVLGFGSRALVIEPASLQERLRTAAECILRQYNDKGRAA